LQAAQSPSRIVDRVYSLLEDDLLRRMLKRLAGEPTPMR
jgi:hypothetical protein